MLVPAAGERTFILVGRRPQPELLLLEYPRPRGWNVTLEQGNFAACAWRALVRRNLSLGPKDVILGRTVCVLSASRNQPCWARQRGAGLRMVSTRGTRNNLRSHFDRCSLGDATGLLGFRQLHVLQLLELRRRHLVKSSFTCIG